MFFINFLRTMSRLRTDLQTLKLILSGQSILPPNFFLQHILPSQQWLMVRPNPKLPITTDINHPLHYLLLMISIDTQQRPPLIDPTLLLYLHLPRSMTNLLHHNLFFNFLFLSFEMPHCLFDCFSVFLLNTTFVSLHCSFP